MLEKYVGQELTFIPDLGDDSCLLLKCKRIPEDFDIQTVKTFLKTKGILIFASEYIGDELTIFIGLFKEIRASSICTQLISLFTLYSISVKVYKSSSPLEKVFADIVYEQANIVRKSISKDSTQEADVWLGPSNFLPVGYSYKIDRTPLEKSMGLFSESIDAPELTPYYISKCIKANNSMGFVNIGEENLKSVLSLSSIFDQ